MDSPLTYTELIMDSVTSDSWVDVFRYNLIDDPHIKSTEDKDCEIKVSVSTLQNLGNIKCVLTQLRRYKNGKPTKQGITLRLSDLEVLWDQSEDKHYRRKYTSFTSGRKIRVEPDQSSDKETISIGEGETLKSITVDHDIFRQFIEAIPTLKYVVSGICKTEKDEIAQECIYAIIALEMKKLSSDGSIKCKPTDDLIKVRTMAQMEIVEHTLNIPKEMTVSIFTRDFWVLSPTPKFAEYKLKERMAEYKHEWIISRILLNETFVKKE